MAEIDFRLLTELIFLRKRVMLGFGEGFSVDSIIQNELIVSEEAREKGDFFGAI